MRRRDRDKQTENVNPVAGRRLPRFFIWLPPRAETTPPPRFISLILLVFFHLSATSQRPVFNLAGRNFLKVSQIYGAAVLKLAPAAIISSWTHLAIYNKHLET